MTARLILPLAILAACSEVLIGTAEIEGDGDSLNNGDQGSGDVTAGDADQGGDLQGDGHDCAEWTSQDIGPVEMPGSLICHNGTFTMTGSGEDIWDNNDEFRFTYRQVDGDVSIVARVVSHDSTHEWSKAGVMIRESLVGDSAHVHMLLSSSATNSTKFDARLSTGATTAGHSGTVLAAPYWIKIERLGDIFQGFESADGSFWTLVGTHTVSMTNNVYVGLSLTSNENTALATAVYDNVFLGAPEPSAGVFEFSTLGLSVEEAGGSVDVTVSRVGGSSGAATVQWRTQVGTAEAPSDFEAVDWTTLSFADGQTSQIVSVTINDDAIDESTETFSLELGNATVAAINPTMAVATVSIVDDGSFPSSQVPPTGWTSYPTVPTRPEFLGQVQDSMFGGYAKRILNESTHWGTGSRDGGMSYPTISSAFNSTDTRILIGNNRRDYIDATTYEHLGIRDGFVYPIWSNRTDGDYPYTLWGVNAWDSLEGPAHFYRMNSETGAILSVHDFSANYDRIRAIRAVSDNDLAVVAGLRKSTQNWFIIVYDPITDTVVSESELTNPRVSQNLEPKGVKISHSGTYYTVIWGYGFGYDDWGHCQAFYRAENHELLAWAGPGDCRFAHADFCLNTDGEDVWVVSGMHMFTFPEQIKQSTGTLLTPWDPNPPGNAWGYQHLGCSGPPGWVYGGGGLLSTWSYSVLFAPGVISRLKLDGSGEVQIWGHAHAIGTSANYVGDWTDPYPKPSRRGDRVLFGSKWNAPDQPATNSTTHLYIYSMTP